MIRRVGRYGAIRVDMLPFFFFIRTTIIERRLFEDTSPRHAVRLSPVCIIAIDYVFSRLRHRHVITPGMLAGPTPLSRREGVRVK